jgi:hypothetical protein
MMPQNAAIQSANNVKSKFMACEKINNGLAPREVLIKTFKKIAPRVDLDVIFKGYEEWSGTSPNSPMVDYNLFVDWVFGVTMRLFTSHQHTIKANDEIRKWMKEFGSEFGSTEPLSVKASVPPFNVRLKAQLLDGLVEFNIPSYGVRLPRAIMKLFDSEGFKSLAAELQIPVPYYAMDTFVQKKMKKVLDMVDVASKRPDCSSGKNQEAVEKLRAFATEFKDLKGGVDIKSPEDFMAWVEKHCPPGWEDRLHFDHLLPANFGFEEQTANELRQTAFEFEDNGEMKSEKLENHSLRWLGKAFKGWAPVGCLTDCINLIYAMTSHIPPENADENVVVAAVEQFKQKIDAHEYSSLWIPTHYVHDAEVDDALSWLLLEYLHRLQSSKLYVLVQLPENGGEYTFDPLEVKTNNLPAGRYRVFRDQESGNGKAVTQTWSTLLK